MQKLLCTAALSALAMMSAAAASAQTATRTWVSGSGSDANTCTRGAPCATFAAAYAKTSASGEIACVDSGSYGPLTISQSIAIRCNGSEGGVQVTSGDAITIQAGASDVVYLEGLDIDGANSGADGVTVNSATMVHIVNCTIRGFKGGVTGQQNGVLIEPSAGSLDVAIVRSRIEHNGVGIHLRPSGVAGASVAVSGTFTNDNIVGVQGNGAATTGTLYLTIVNSLSHGNSSTGFNLIQGTAASATMMLNQAVASANGIGLRVDGPAAIARLGGSKFAGNAPGGDLATAAGGQILSYATNSVDDASMPPTTPLK
jgi:hypothetical protein